MKLILPPIRLGRLCSLLMLVLPLFILTGKVKAQTQLYYENFNSGGSTTWSLNATDMGDDPANKNYWLINNIYLGGGLIVTTPNEPAAITGYPQSYYMHITDGGFNTGKYNTNFNAPATGNVFTKMNAAIVTTGYSNVTLTFWYLCNGGNVHYTGQLYYSIDGGVNWIAQGTYYEGVTSWTQATITNATFDNVADLRFAFQWTQTGAGALTAADPPIAVDEILVVGTASASCPINITNESSTNPTCSDSTNGTITITATGGTSLTYTINNGAAISNGTGIFTGLPAGTYTITVSDTCTTNGTNIVLTSPAAVPAPTATNNGPLCTGGSLQLNASTVAGASYSWTGPNNFSTQNPSLTNVSLTDSGIYTVVAMVGGCFSAPAITDVIIHQTPPSPVASNNGPLCSGDSLQLNATTVAGASYTWTGVNSFNIQNPNIPVTTLNDSGLYIVVATIAGCNSAPDTTDVVINPTPAASVPSNNGPLCVGDLLQLTATTVSGASYNWTGPNNFSTQNPSIPGVALTDSGIYTLVTSIGNCSSQPLTTDVVISPPPPTPVASNNGPLCSGDSLQLVASGSAGITYTWTGPNSFNVQNPSITNVALSDSGEYYVVASAGSCTSATDSTHVSINPTPAASVPSNNGPLCVGDLLQLNGTAVAGASYNWTGPNNFSTQNPSIATVALTDSGVYTLVTSIGNCSSQPLTTEVVVSPPPATPVASNNGPLCTGDSLQLSATGNAGITYTWTGPNNFNVQNPTISSVSLSDSGTYVVIATAGSCASAPDSTVVIVNQTPGSPGVSNNGPLCVGDSLALNASLVVGAFYSWTGPNNFSIQNPSISNVSISDSGIYTLIITLGACNSNPVTTDVVVSPPPATPVVSNNGPLCTGDSLQLTASGNTGITYTWTGPNNFNTQNPNLTNVSLTDSGVYTVIATAGSCSSLPATTDVIINATPASAIVSNNGPLCAGDALQLNASTVTGASYTWTGPNNFNQQNPTIPVTTLNDSGTYTVIATIGSCSSAPSSTTVIISPPPAAPVVSNNGPLCAGDTLMLFASNINGASFVWTGPNSFNQQNPILPGATTADSGIYTVVAIIGSCSSTLAYTDVVITPLPATPTATNNGPVCEGSSLQFSTSTVAGASYTWTGPNSFNTQNPSINTAGLGDSGVYTLIVTVAGCNSVPATTDVVIIPTPQAPSVSNNGPLCPGDTLQITATNVAGATYGWTGPNDFSTQNPFINGVAVSDGGTYTLVITVNGCNSLPVTTSVIINPAPAPPTITANDTVICPNDSAQICVGSAYPSYLWNTSETSQCIYTNLAGNYYVTITDANGCTAVSEHLAITVLPSPPVGISQSGDTLTAENAISWQWYRNDSLIPGATSRIYVASTADQYSVVVTDSNGCVAQSSEVQATNINAISNNLNFEIYPNPATNKLTIVTDAVDAGKTTLQICDVEGRLIIASDYVQLVSKSNAAVTEIDVSKLPAGMYLLRLGQTVKKFVKE